MNHKKYRESAKSIVVEKHFVKNIIAAFISGGLMGVFAQFLFGLYSFYLGVSDASAISFAIVTIIFITSLLTGIGIYDKVAQHCGGGLFIPISGFANALTSCAMEGKSEGLIYGIGSNMFKLAGSVLTYGISSAFVFGMIRYLLFGG